MYIKRKLLKEGKVKVNVQIAENCEKVNTQLSAMSPEGQQLEEKRTHYGKFNIRFQGPYIWNSIDDDIKLSSISMFKKKNASSISWKILANTFIVYC